jgi:hypothetical protein
MSEFRQLSGFCIPEKLTVIAEIRFELHNMYLAANWNEAEELFRRVALLGLLDPSELHALRGQFWFLSVFGRQIQHEMSEEGLSCDWVYSLPDRSHRSPAFDHFARPELLEKGSPPHWVLVAWCTNPRSPEPIPGPEPPRINEDGLLIDSLE